MGLYRLQTEEDLYINNICENCLYAYINTGDSIIAEQYFDAQFYSIINEEENLYPDDHALDFKTAISYLEHLPGNKRDQIINQAKEDIKKMTKEMKETSEKYAAIKRKKDDEEYKRNNPNLYKIKSAYVKIKKWFEDKLQKVSKWADECKDNKEKTILTRIIAFIVRMMRKVTNKINLF